eukprot:9888345-Prorocentrum_lima.AAC.1
MRHYSSEERGRVDCLPPAPSAIAPQRGRDDPDGWRGERGGDSFRKVFPVFQIVGEYLFPEKYFLVNDFRRMNCR